MVIISPRQAAAHPGHASDLPRLEQILSASPVVIYTLDPVTWDGTWVSGNITRLFGYTPGEALERGWWWRNVHPDDRERLQASNARSRAEGRGRDEYRMRDARGEYRWVLDELVVVRGEDGEAAEVVGSWTDVTAARSAEEACRQSERDYRRLFETAQDAIVLMDPATEEVLDANPRASEVYGIPRDAFVGRSMRELTMDPARGEARLRETLRDGRQISFQTVHRRSDGTLLDLEINASVVEYRGRTAILSINRDVTARRQAEQALRRSERRFRLLVDHVADALVVHDLEGRIVDANARACESLGYRRDELLGKTVAEVEVGAPLAEVTQRLGGGTVTVSGTHRRRDGSTFPVETRLTLFQDEGGPLVLALARDASRERRAEAALRESEALFRGVFARAAVGMVLAGTDGTILEVNPFFEAMLGFPADDLYGRLISSITHPADRESSRRGFERMLAGETETYDREKRFVRADGRVIWARQTLSLVRDAGGAPEMVVGVIEDVSDRRAAEEAVRRSEKHFRSLIGRARDVVTVLGPALEVRYVSPAVEEVLGWAPDALVGTRGTALVHEDDLPGVQRLLAEVMARPEGTGRAEIRMRHASGGWRTLEAVATNWLHDPDIGGVVVNSRDVTDRREVERALQESEQRLAQAQKMEAVGRLAGGVAHDFNNMLTAIKGNAQLALLTLPQDAPVREDLREIEAAAERAAQLTSQLLAFSRQQVLQPTEICLNARVEAIAPMLRRLIGEDVALVTGLDPALPAVRADGGRVEQVILNLAVNARDAMPEGGTLRMETRAVRVERTLSRGAFAVLPGCYAALRVSDTGVGMSPGVLAHIFEPFFTTKETGKGTGLGLSTVYGIVKQSGGYIWAESRPGEGSVFHIYLPAADAGAAAPEPPAPRAEPARGSETILLVEDEDAVRMVARKSLARCGFRVLDAAGPDEGMRLFGEHAGEIDLVVTDVVMPGTGGPRFARDLLRLRPELPVLFVSGYMEEKALGGEGGSLPGPILAKPFTPDLLVRRVREVLDARPPG